MAAGTFTAALFLRGVQAGFDDVLDDHQFRPGISGQSCQHVIIDLILAGDNALIIAMVVRSLSHDQRKWGILFVAGAAVPLRVILTIFTANLLNISFVKLVGGVRILWIAVKLFGEGTLEEEQENMQRLFGTRSRSS